MRRWYDIYVNGQLFDSVYDEQDIIKVSCDLVNGSGVDPEAIEVKTRGDEE